MVGHEEFDALHVITEHLLDAAAAPAIEISQGQTGQFGRQGRANLEEDVVGRDMGEHHRRVG